MGHPLPKRSFSYKMGHRNHTLCVDQQDLTSFWYFRQTNVWEEDLKERQNEGNYPHQTRQG